jgi:hypothetical protein
MYGLLELLTVVCVVVVLAVILFVVSAAVIVVNEGMRSVLGLSAKYVRQVASFSTAIPFAPVIFVPGQVFGATLAKIKTFPPGKPPSLHIVTKTNGRDERSSQSARIS